MSLENVLSRIPGLAGYLATQQFQQRQALGDLQGAQALANTVIRAQEAAREQEIAPLRRQLLEVNTQKARRDLAAEEELSGLRAQIPEIVASIAPVTSRR